MGCSAFPIQLSLLVLRFHLVSRVQWLVLSLGGLSGGYGFASHFLVTELTQEAGLPQNQVRSVAQDRLGFIWFGTQEGLARYDGYRFEVFRHDPEDPRSLSHNIINMILPDGKDGLWLATFGGLCRFDARTQTARAWRAEPSQKDSLPEDQVRAVHLDVKDRLWLALQSQGLYLMVGEQFQKVPLEFEQEDGFRVNAMASTSSHLWVATSKGLFQVRLQDQTVAYKGHPPGVNHLTSLLLDQNGRLWVGSMDGVFRFDAEQGWIECPSQLGVKIGRTSAIFQTKDKVIWFGTEEGALHLLPDATRITVAPLGNPAQSQQNHRIIAGLEDATGNIWLGTFGSGAMRVSPKGLGFQTLRGNPAVAGSLSGSQVISVLQDNHDCLWVGTSGNGLNLRQPGATLFEQPHGPGAPDPGASVYSMAENKGQVWFGIGRRLFRHNKTTNLTPVGPEFPSEVSQIVDAGAGRLWVGTYRAGLFLMDLHLPRILAHYRSEALGDLQIAHNMVLSLAASKEGGLWVGTLEGLDYISPRGKRTRVGEGAVHQGGLSHQAIADILTQQDGLWLGTNGGGIDFLEPKTGRVTAHLDKTLGLPSDFVMGLTLDRWGQLWASTTDGLARIDPETGQCVSFDRHDGLPSNEFVIGAAYATKTGQLYLGSSDGLVFFEPFQPQSGLVPPPLVLTELQISNAPTLPKALDPESPLELTIPYTKELVLDDRHKVFTLEFSALDFTRPDKNRYAYLLEGFDSTWAYTNGARRFATYTNLDPGNYVFMVKGTNPDGVWNETGTRLAIKVKPHPLLSPFAKVMYLLVLATIAAAYLRLQRIALKSAQQVAARDRALAEKEREHNHQLEREVEERTKKLMETEKMLMRQEKLASLGTLAAGVAHEIRNPLNFVNNFAEVIDGYIQDMKGSLETITDRNDTWIDVTELLHDMEESAKGIHRHGKRAESIVEDMLGFAQGRKATFGSAELNTVVREYANLSFQSMRNRYEGEKLELTYQLDEAVGQIQLDTQGISRVILNLVNNAFEAAHARSLREPNHRCRVVISTGQTEKSVWVKVRDNGTGIQPEHIDQIFRPFFTTKPGEKHNVGLGLAISYDIVVGQHGGQLTVQSEWGSSTEFTLSLPHTQPKRHRSKSPGKPAK